MMRFSILSAFAALFLLAGCAEPVLFSEVFQLKEGQKIYTKYNIWYDDPDSISSLNIQRGSLLPLGTEVIPVETTNIGDKIRFKDTAGKVYTIDFNSGYRLCTMRDFIAYTFTTETRDEQLKGISPKVRARILRGEVVPGMSSREVILAYGPPPAARTPDMRNATWFYWVTPSNTVRLVFRGDKVRNILNLSEEL